MQTKYIKETGIITSYLWLLIAVYFFDWNPIGIFLSVLVEFTIILVTFWYLNITSTKKNKPAGNILLAGGSLILLQYFIIGLLADFLHEESFDFSNPSTLFDRYTIASIIFISIMYSIRLLSLKNKSEKESFAQENLLIQALILTGMNLIGFFAIQIFEISGAFPVLVIMVIGRILLELYVNNWNKK